MSKKTETHDKALESDKPARKAKETPVHLKVLADLQTGDTMYLQGDEIDVSADEAQALILEHAGYFEVVADVQKDE